MTLCYVNEKLAYFGAHPLVYDQCPVLFNCVVVLFLTLRNTEDVVCIVLKKYKVLILVPLFLGWS